MRPFISEERILDMIAPTCRALDRQTATVNRTLQLLAVRCRLQIRTIAGEEIEIVGIAVTQVVRGQRGAAGKVKGIGTAL